VHIVCLFLVCFDILVLGILPMIATISKILQSNAFGFASFCKKRYFTKVNKNVKTYYTKCIVGFVILDMQFEWIFSKIIC
jgi:hypothetical protein